MRNARTIGVLVGGALAASMFALPAFSANVTQERLNNAQDAEPHNWIHHHKNYFGWRHVTLDEVTAGNVSELKIVFTVAVGGGQGAGRHDFGRLEGTPIVEDGFMYYPNGWGEVYKVDVTSGTMGTVVWLMDPAVDKAYAADVACCGVNNRGVALWEDQVISTTLDSRVVSTHKDTGEITWEVAIGDPAIAETVTHAPLVMNDIAVAGVAGAEYGCRCHLDGVSLTDGTLIWRTYTAGGNDRDPNEIAKTTWLDDYNSWETGGGSIWQTGTYDPELNLMYWGTGNPGPDWDPEYRPGDNLYTDTLLAMDPEEGMIHWYFQYTPNDPYDYDEIAEHPLIDIDGQRLVTHASRNGFFYGFDRASGEFQYAIQYVNDVIWTDGIDQKTGLPNSYNPNTGLQDYRNTAERRNGRIGIHCPRISGGKNWPPSATNPDTLITYVPGIEGCQLVGAVQAEHPESKGGPVKPRDSWTGGRFGVTMDELVGEFSLEALGLSPEELGPLEITGSIVAVDLRTGETINKIQTRYNTRAGMLSTAGGWVMTGHLDGNVTAYDADTLEELWSYNTGTPIRATPMSYSHDGKQYIALMVGGNISGGDRERWPELAHIQFMHAVYVWTL